MSTDAVPRLPLRSLARPGAMLAALVLLGTPALAQFTPRFETLAPLSVSIGADPGKHSFVLADVNDDRRPDLITIEPRLEPPSRVDVYINQGDGTFDLVSTPPLIEDEAPAAVAVADVGSPFGSPDAGKPDGKPDIIVGGEDGETQVIFGRNDGQFDPPESVIPSDDIPILDDVVGLVVGDFKEGNGLDVALLGSDGVVLLCNDGNGELSVCSGDEPIEAGNDPAKIVSGDFDGDADLDVAVLNPSDQNVLVLHGNGDGTFAEPVTVNVAGEASGSDSVDMAVGRLDGDNLDDFVAVNDDQVFQFIAVSALGLSNGRFSTKSFVVDFDASAVTVADFDGEADRSGDALVGINGSSSSGVRVSVGNGTGDFPTDSFSPIGTNSIGKVSVLASADLGGDTLPDFVALNADGTQIRVAINKSNEVTPTPGSMTPTTPSPTVTGPPPPTATPTGTRTPTPSATATNTPTPIPTANFGRCDAQVGTSFAAIAAGDLDGDGRPDLAVSDAGAGVVRIIYDDDALVNQLRTCAMAMTLRQIPSTVVDLGDLQGVTPGPLVIGDFDRDGDNDIAVGAGDRVIFLKNTSGVFAHVDMGVSIGGTVQAMTASYPDDSSALDHRAPLDLNGDHVTDLVIANGSSTLTIVYGVASQLPPPTSAAKSQDASCAADYVDAADFNDDRLVDIAVGCGSQAGWMKANSDNEEFEVTRAFDVKGGSQIVGVVAGYLDADGFADLLFTFAGGAPAGQIYTSTGNGFAVKGAFSVGANPIAGGLGLFNGVRRLDAVIAASPAVSQDGTRVLQFAYNDGAGAFPGPVVQPFQVRDTPRALVVVDIDNDNKQDVALANSDGTLTILLSSAPPPTPTPTATPTASATGTVTVTETPSLTPTPTDTPTPTPTASVTPQSTATRTETPSVTPTPRGGIQLSSCAIGGQGGGSSPLQMGLIAALLAGVRLLAAGRARRGGAQHGRHR